jgi:hypothetical protein
MPSARSCLEPAASYRERGGGGSLVDWEAPGFKTPSELYAQLVWTAIGAYLI